MNESKSNGINLEQAIAQVKALQEQQDLANRNYRLQIIQESQLAAATRFLLTGVAQLPPDQQIEAIRNATNLITPEDKNKFPTEKPKGDEFKEIISEIKNIKDSRSS